MVQKVILWGIICGLVGLIFGYLVFGRIAGDYVSISNLINLPENWVEEVGEGLTGVRQIRQRIFITGIAGLVLGSIVSAVLMRK
ncbi:MAG: hypothetical protein ACOC2O_02055 [Bacillota bacterium]